ncbi:MAG: MATE family efflux transporter [Pseudomonadota bacterium]
MSIRQDRDGDTNPDRRIWRIAGPAILSNTSGALVGIVDTWAIGQISSAPALAGLAVGAFVFSVVYWSFGFLRMGTTGMVAQAHGAALGGRILRITLRAAIVGLIIGTALLLVSGLIIAGTLALMDISPAAEGHARTYLEIRFFGTPALMVKVVVIGFLIALERARLALAIEIILNLTNMALTVWFVAGLGWGVSGAAAASLIAEVSAGMTALVVMGAILRPRLVRATLFGRRFWRWAGFLALLHVNSYLFVRTLILDAAFGLLVWSGGRLGDATVAANHVLLEFVSLTALGLDGVAYAAEALAGNAYGRRDKQAFLYWFRRTSGWAAVLSLIYVLIYAMFGNTIVAAFTDVESIRETAADVMPFLIVMPFIAVWSYQLDGVFIGATATRDMMLSMMIAFAIYAPLIIFATDGFGNAGLWLAFLGFFFVRALALAAFLPRLARKATA